jgi:tryptophan synthase alpha chain
MVLKTYLQKRLGTKDILLMTHIVLGYPSFEDCYKIIAAMVRAGVDLMELQIPFSEPMADGPVILRANQSALERGATVQACLEFSERGAGDFDIPFLIMSYYNILFNYGINDFVRSMAERNLKGAIIPDLPPEEGGDYLHAMQIHGLSPIFIFSPTTSFERMRYLSELGESFVYCVARKGVTGKQTIFSGELAGYLVRCQTATHLPIAVGFGIKEKAHIDFLKGKADIAVIGTQTIRIMEKEGVASIGDFIRSLH